MLYWPRKWFMSFDTESTGLNLLSDRIVQVGISLFYDGKFQHGFKWLVKKDIPSCPEALAVHGITDEQCESEGIDQEIVLKRVTYFMGCMRERSLPVICMNSPFDFNLLISNCARYEIDIPRILDGLHIIDPLVIDRRYTGYIPAYRRGMRNLSSLAARYNVSNYPTHDALDDARSVGEIALAMSMYYPPIRRMQLSELHRKQVKWHEEWTAGFHKIAPDIDIPEWPYRKSAKSYSQIAFEVTGDSSS